LKATMRYVAWIGLLLVSLIKLSGGKSLVTTDGTVLGPSSWLQYGSNRRKYPQCCGDSTACSMVRLSEEVIDLVRSTDHRRVMLSDTGKKVSIVAGYNEEREGVKGKVFIGDSEYYLEPTSAEERKQDKCYVRGLRGHMQLYHKLIRLGKIKDDLLRYPPALFSITDTPGNSDCCRGFDQCLSASPDFSVLTNREEEITVPWRGAVPPSDSSERFQLTLSMPAECNGLCDKYYYVSGHSVLKVLKKNKGDVSVTMEEGGVQHMLRKCGGGYVWTTAPVTRSVSTAHQPTRKNTGRSSKNREAEDSFQTNNDLSGLMRATPDCLYPDLHCDIVTDVVSSSLAEGETLQQQTENCSQACLADSSCNHFTWFKARGTAKCYLHSDCLEIRDNTCTEDGNCVSGPKVCGDTNTAYISCKKPLDDIGDEYIKWQCTQPSGQILDLLAYNDTVPVGTICYIRCNSWITQAGSPGYLESSCGADGNWTETVPHNGDAELLFPPAPYPTPCAEVSDSPTPLTCSCPTLSVVWPPSDPNGTYYDPNDEKATDFICDIPVDQSNGTYCIEPNNECRMWCDDYLLASVRCKNGEWTGSPGLGFWCYKRPFSGPGGARNWNDNYIYIDYNNNWGYGNNPQQYNYGDYDQQQWMMAMIFMMSMPVNGGFSAWCEWSTCSSGGTRTRSRDCDNPAPRNGGRQCAGDSVQTQDCAHGAWSDWGDWSNCTNNEMSRTRTCTAPAPLNGGNTCRPAGYDEQIDSCVSA